jgi:L-tartrate/succinate antiporter
VKRSADGLSRSTSVKWFAEFVAAHVGGFTPSLILVLLVIGDGADHQHHGRTTSDATGPGLAYYNSGHLPPADFWRLETIFGLIFLTALLAVVTMSS